jgi:hypothetical protein
MDTSISPLAMNWMASGYRHSMTVTFRSVREGSTQTVSRWRGYRLDEYFRTALLKESLHDHVGKRGASL